MIVLKVARNKGCSGRKRCGLQVRHCATNYGCDDGEVTSEEFGFFEKLKKKEIIERLTTELRLNI